MSYRELIDALNAEAEEKIRKVWEAVRAEADSVRRETTEVLERLHEQCRATVSSEAGIKVETILAEANNRAQTIRLEAKKKMSERVYHLARSSLGALRDDRYGDVLALLIKELPVMAWDLVVVNPEDRDMAQQRFPTATVTTDPSVAGGVAVSINDGRIYVDNTFEKRLEKAWPDILIHVMRDLCKASERA